MLSRSLSRRHAAIARQPGRSALLALPRNAIKAVERSSNIHAAFRRKYRSASMSASSTQHQAARSSRSAMWRGSMDCHSAIFAASSYFSEPRQGVGRKSWREFVPHMLTKHRRHLGFIAEVALRSRVATPAARVNEIGQWLRPRCSFVEIGSLSTERVRRNDSLRAECRCRRSDNEARSAVASSFVLDLDCDLPHPPVA